MDQVKCCEYISEAMYLFKRNSKTMILKEFKVTLFFFFFFYQHYIFQFKKRPSFSTYLTQTLLNRIHSRCTVTALWSMWSFVGRSKICVHTETWSTLPSGHLHDEHSLQIQILLNDPSHPSWPVHWEFSLRPKPDHEMQSDQK